MANRRMIAADIWRDDFVCTLDHFERLLWIGMIVTCADDQGRFQDKPGFIGNDVFPGEELSIAKIEAVLKHFEQGNKIVRYIADNVKLIQVVNWWDYQTPTWAMSSKYTAPTNWTDRIKQHVKITNKVEMTNWDMKGGFPEGYVHSTLYSKQSSRIDENRLNEMRLNEMRVEAASQPKIDSNLSGPSIDSTTAWNQALGLIEPEIGHPFYETYITTLKPSLFLDGRFTLSTSNKFNADLINKRAGQTIKKVLSGIYGKPIDLEIKAVMQ